MFRRGFTLIEVVLVIAILGILAVTAFTRYQQMTLKAEISKMNGIAGAVRSGIALYKMNSIVANGGLGMYPTSLDSGGVCFGAVLEADLSETSLVFRCGPPSPEIYRYRNGGVSANWVYTSSDGKFDCVWGTCSN